MSVDGNNAQNNIAVPLSGVVRKNSLGISASHLHTKLAPKKDTLQPHSSSYSTVSTVLAENKYACPVSIGNASGGDALMATDAIIEELKALAKSMLDATNAARHRANFMENRRSYEALINAIEGDATNKTTPRTVNAARENKNFTKDGAYQKSTSVFQSECASQRGLTSVDMLESQETPLVSKPSHLSHLTGSIAYSNNRTAVHQRAELVEAVPIPTLQQSQGHKLPIPSASGNDDSSVEISHSGHGAIKDNNETHEEHRHRAGWRQWRMTTATDANSYGDTEEDNIYNGVKTQIIFYSVDQNAYQDVASSIWKPERLLRTDIGSIIPQSDSDEESGVKYDANNYNMEKSTFNRTGATEDVSRCSKGNDIEFSTDGEEARGPLALRKPTRVYRMPSFPYGGGVTEAQARELSQKFQKCNRQGPPRDSLSTFNPLPRFISKKDFDTYAYEEVCGQTDAQPFNPTSPYEFVVEIEQSILFDATQACERRRKEHRKLAKQGHAPRVMGTFNLRVIMDPIKIGFEEDSNFPIIRGSIVAGRYQIIQLLGKATFSHAVRCYDLCQPIYDDDNDCGEAMNGEKNGDQDDGAACEGVNAAQAVAGVTADSSAVSFTEGKRRKPIGYAEVCLKIINNTKDFFDQSLDEIRLLTLLNSHRDPDEVHIVRLLDFFYYKEHMMLVTELLCDNLYEYSKYNREEEEEPYFTIPRLRSIARQIIEALVYVHSLGLIHADLKPENVLFVSHRQCIVKVIDFGSSCFLSDHLSSYIQSRSYRAPEVILGCNYDGRIDVWSLGAILMELATGDVLFNSESITEMLARIVYVCGTPFPRQMLWEGRHTFSFINKYGCIYEAGRGNNHANHMNGDDDYDGNAGAAEVIDREEPYCLYTPAPCDISIPSNTNDKFNSSVAASRQNSSFMVDPVAAPNTNGGVGFKKTQDSDVLGSVQEVGPYAVLRQKLADVGMLDELFFSFLKTCLSLDHKKRPTSAELLKHPFIVNEHI